MRPLLALLLAALAALAPAADPLRLCAATPDLAAIARAVGGDAVAVTVFAKPGDDPHFVEARPSFIAALHRADLLLITGLELEVGWIPPVIQAAANPRVQPGAEGHFDASTAIRVRDAATGPVDRSQGDIHPAGNPHYLLDPVATWPVARRLHERLLALRPAAAAAFEANHAQLATALAGGLVGERLAAGAPAEVLDRLAGEGAEAWLDAQPELGGWLGRLAPRRGAKLVADHDAFGYLAARYRLAVVGFLEPKPGLPPTSHHLVALAAQARAEGVTGLLTVPWFDPRHVRTVADAAGLPVIRMAHQPGALPGTADLIAWHAANAAALAEALRAP